MNLHGHGSRKIWAPGQMLFQKLFYRLTKLSFIKVGLKLFAMNFSFNFYFLEKVQIQQKRKLECGHQVSGSYLLMKKTVSKMTMVSGQLHLRRSYLSLWRENFDRTCTSNHLKCNKIKSGISKRYHQMAVWEKLKWRMDHSDMARRNFCWAYSHTKERLFSDIFFFIDIMIISKNHNFFLNKKYLNRELIN